MAGKRQHYLPRFLQRGFCSSPGSERTWVYRKGHQPRELGIGDTGVERNFYSEGEDTTVDDTITEAERIEYSALVNQARTAKVGLVSGKDFSRLLAHLEVRSRNLRQGLLLSVDYLCQETLLRFRELGPQLLKSRQEEILIQARQALRARGSLPNSLRKSCALPLRR